MLIYMNDLLKTSLNKMTELPSLLKDKDKLFIVANICISNVNRDLGVHMLAEIDNHFKKQFDDTVKFFVMPVLVEEKQGLEILNPKFATNEMIQTLQENYENLLKILEEKSSKNE